MSDDAGLFFPSDDTKGSPLNAHPANSVFTTYRLGPLDLRNRVIKCGTNEGLSRGGLVTEALIDWHRRFARGGVAITTLSYCSVSAEGRTFADQVWMRDEAMPGLRRFTDAIHAEGARAAIQLGHAGWFASRKVIGGRPIGPSATLSPHGQAVSRKMDTGDFKRVRQEFADAARLAVDAGFDALEVHLGHGYLLSQFLSPYNNRRRDDYGGSIENRARFPREVLVAVRDAAGPDVAIWPKLNMLDGFRGGLELHEGLAVARLIEADGTVDALQLTGGHTLRSPMFLMRGDVPLREMIRYEKDRIRKLGMQLLGPFLIRKVPFEEGFFLPCAKQFRAELEIPLMLLGGINELSTMNTAIDEEGFELIAVGRALLRDPDLVNRMRQGEAVSSLCNHWNICMAEMERESGTRCVLLEGSAG
jgi:2,4-dienoyl-CoA reductase-like NADH-dependent reductase (Old Yellow Enzyme family)